MISKLGKFPLPPVVRLARSLYLTCAEHALAHSANLKKELQEKMAKAATPVGDEVLVQLAAKYKGRLFYDYERDKITHRIEDIKHVANNWEAECIPVELTAEGWSVPSKYSWVGPIWPKQCASHSAEGLTSIPLWFFVLILCKMLPLLPECSRENFA
jgi:hypothetical protein